MLSITFYSLYVHSLSVFIVSDSENVSGEDDSDNELPPRPLIYHTPCTPKAGVMFWGDISPQNMPPNTKGSCPQHQQDSSTRSLDITKSPRHQQDSSTGSLDITRSPRHQQDSSTRSLDITGSPIHQQDPSSTRFPDTPESSGNNHHPIPHYWQRRPFTERKLLPRTPLNRPPPSQPITTPSAAKNFSRAKNKMITELFQLFNESVFDRLVSRMLLYMFGGKHQGFGQIVV